MGLFGIKKADEDNKSSNTFINESVINAQDYSNMPNNTIVGYNDPTLENSNVNVENIVSPEVVPETFVYSQIDMNENQSVDSVVMTVDSNTYAPIDTPVLENESSSVIEPSVPFDNSALFEMPAGAIQEQPVSEEVEVLEELDTSDIELPEVVEEVIPQYDPLNNANNPIPVNPVAEGPAPDELGLFEEEVEVKTNLITVMNMIIGIIIKPATTIFENVKNYTKFLKSLLLSFWMGIFSFIFCLIGRLIAGSFSTTKDAISGASKINLDFSGLFNTSNYVPYLLITLLIGFVAIIIIALVYYFSSFVSSKGVHIGVYFAISSLSIVPTIIGFTILHPIISILSSSIALLVLMFCIIYTLIILFTGINYTVKFKTADGALLYNAVNIAIIFSIMVFIFSTLSTLNILDLVFILR